MLKSFDIFPKAKETELTVRTNAGGILSLLSLLFLVVSVAFEVVGYSELRTKSKMVLNEKPLPPVLPIELDIEVANNCSNLHFDFTNTKRTMNIDAEVRKNFVQRGSKCVIHVDVQAPNVPASFHIGLGESYWNDKGDHSHMWFTVEDRNLSHRINLLRFGEGENSLAGGTELVFPRPTAYMITYRLQLVPVTNGTRLGYQAIPSIAKTNLEKIRTRGIPAVIFQWNFAPIGIEATRGREPVINLVCHLLAVTGCFFVCVRFIDSTAFAMKMF